MSARYELNDGLATITLNRPEKLNALTVEMREALGSHFETAARDNAVRAVLLTANGKAFCASGDVSKMGDFDPHSARELLRLAHRMVRNLANIEKPVVASVRGAVAGGALIGFAVAAYVWVACPRDERAPRPAGDKAAARRVMSPAILGLTGFFVLIAMSLGGINNFGMAALVAGRELTLGLASAGLTAFLVGSASGVLLGGRLADRVQRHGLVAGAGFAGAAAATLCVVLLPLPGVAMVALPRVRPLAAMRPLRGPVMSSNPSPRVVTCRRFRLWRNMPAPPPWLSMAFIPSKGTGDQAAAEASVAVASASMVVRRQACGSQRM